MQMSDKATALLEKIYDKVNLNNFIKIKDSLSFKYTENDISEERFTYLKSLEQEDKICLSLYSLEVPEYLPFGKRETLFE